LRYWKARRIETQNVRRAKYIISNSQFIREYLSRYIRGEVYDIDNPVAKNFFDVADQSTHNRLLVVGKLIYRKGIHVLLDALPFVLENHPEVKVRFAGSTAAGKEPQAYWAGIERQVSTLGLNEAVSFLGELDEPDLLDEYARCGAVVSAASMETSAMGILEAMAAGRPIVGTRVGGTPWLIEHGRNGLLVDPNDPSALAAALNQLLSNEEARREMGRQSKAMAEGRCRADIVAAQTVRVLKGIIEDRPRT
jgi:glycosyltransferase involved in cell wall biosynthesis